MTTVVLEVYNNGQKSPYHITVARVNMDKAAIPALQAALVRLYGGTSVGASQPYTLTYVGVWGQNSFLTEFTRNTGAPLQLDQVRRQMFGTIQNTPGVTIDTSRYGDRIPAGFCPQHMDTKGKDPTALFPNLATFHFVISIYAPRGK